MLVRVSEKNNLQKERLTNCRGFTFVELIVTAAVVSLIFGGLLAGLQLSMKLIVSSKVSVGALALAKEQMEYIHSLPYNEVGTVGGIPNGLIPQNATTSLNGITYTERVFIQYVDSPDDGLGASDVNGILADYKQAKVEYSWKHKNGTSSLFLLSNIVPPGIESVVGGGTLSVNVFNALVQPLAGAEVHLYNDTSTNTIDIVTFTNADGQAMFAGAPAAANYQITVTDTGFSTDGTYAATGTIANPNPPHVAVIESVVSTMSFQIDELSDLTVRTIGPSIDGQFIDELNDLSSVYAHTDTVQSGTGMELAGVPGSYPASGTVLSASTTPSVITAWDTALFDTNTPASTLVHVQVYEASGTSTYTLIPDADLPGNSTGFTISPINLSGLDTDEYPALALFANLSTTDPNATPLLDSWEINYIVDEPPIGNVAFLLRGDKTVGTTVAAEPVYKYEESHQTDGNGIIVIENIEWDVYNLMLQTGSYDIAEVCGQIPYALEPGVDETIKLTVVPDVSRSLRIYVSTGDGTPVPGATVEVSRAGFLDSDVTSNCGQIFFGSGLAEHEDYQIEVSAAGYVTETIVDFWIDGDETLSVVLSS